MVWFQVVGGMDESGAGVEMCNPADDKFNTAEAVSLEVSDLRRLGQPLKNSTGLLPSSTAASLLLVNLVPPDLVVQGHTVNPQGLR